MGGIKLKFNKLNEIFVENNDIYVLECHQKRVIVNNNYSGIKLYNMNLELQSKIDIFEDIIITPFLRIPIKMRSYYIVPIIKYLFT
jgi:hypothetical protein